MKEDKAPTRAYTPGRLGWAQPYPQETTPIKVLDPSTIGPPLSPWQESLPPEVRPAQNMRSETTSSGYALRHCVRETTGTETLRRVVVPDPPWLVAPLKMS
jgi:hypothetical protein